jgi:phage shock protein A
MKWLNDFTLIMRSSITALRETVQDPERMIHQLIIDMEEELERVRTSVASAIADEIQLRKQVEGTRDESRQWMDRATSALRRRDESGSKAALEQKVLAEQRANSLDTEYRKQQEQTAKLQRSVRDLEDKIRQARQKQTLLLARLVRAESEQRIDRALKQTTSQSAFAQFSRLEHRVERAEAMSEAYDRLEGRDPTAEELARQFEEKERKEQTEKQFEELKRRVEESAQ